MRWPGRRRIAPQAHLLTAVANLPFENSTAQQEYTLQMESDVTPFSRRVREHRENNRDQHDSKDQVRRMNQQSSPATKMVVIVCNKPCGHETVATMSGAAGLLRSGQLVKMLDEWSGTQDGIFRD